MQISAKVHYAAKALLELALHWPNNTPLQIGTISEKQKIPEKFLTQILILLKQHGVVTSIRGKNGGYLLNQAPQSITLKFIYQHLGSSENGTPDKSDHDNIIDRTWMQLDDLLNKKMDAIDFEMLANQHKRLNNAVNFEI